MAEHINEERRQAKSDSASSDAPGLPLDPRMSEEDVKRRFWPKVRRVIARVPFMDDLVAAYFCATDPRTPVRVKGVLFAALGYFILPTDLVPDFIVALGFSDDATVLATTLAVVGAHVKERHRDKARNALGLAPEASEEEDEPSSERDTLLDVTPGKGASHS